MRKIVLLLTVFTCMMFACKKVYHSTKPTPDNYRLNGYTVVTTQNIISPLSITPVVTEQYSFNYDGNGRVSKVYFTSNDSNKVKAGLANLVITYFYVADSIYKTSTDVKTTTVKERDTFIVNSSNQITNSYFPNEVHTFNYFGKLLANEMVGFRDTGTLITANLTYTSNNGDFLYRQFNGTLNVSFEDTGIRPDISPVDTTRDTVLSLPINVSWTQFSNNGTSSTLTNSGLNAYADVMNGYDQNTLVVTAVDPNGVMVRPGYFPSGYCAKQFYQIYDFLTNRPGDYLQLQSFTTYGVNIYQNVHMIREITTPFQNSHFDYIIDADSKVSSTSAIIRDSLLKNVTTQQYTLQWDTY